MKNQTCRNCGWSEESHLSGKAKIYECSKFEAVKIVVESISGKDLTKDKIYLKKIKPQKGEAEIPKDIQNELNKLKTFKKALKKQAENQSPQSRNEGKLFNITEKDLK